MKVYVDNVVVYTAKANQLSTSLSISSGQHHITVNAWDSSGAVFKSSSLTLTVSSTVPTQAPVSITIAPTIANVAPGQTQQFTATVTNATNTAVIWQVDGVTGGNAGVGTISASGLYTGGTSTGTHNVVAISQADTTKGATAIVTLTAPTIINACTAASAPPSVTICNPVNGSTVYGPVTFAAVAASNTPVTKFLLYLDYVLVDQSNTASIDAGLTVATGTHHLTAQFYTGTAWVKQSETFTVSSAPAVSVGINPSTASMLPSGTQQFTATVQNTSNTAVAWSVDGTANGNASVGTIVVTGGTVTYTAPSSAGSHTVTATSMADGTKFASATVTVTAPPAVSVGVNPSTASMLSGGTQQFTATVQNTSNTAVAWSVDGTANGNASVGTITATGATATYTAPSSAGSHTVTATSMADGTKFASATVTVTTAPTFPKSSHVFVVMEENQSFSQVFPSGTATSSNCSSSGMPYLCSLAAANGMALNFYANDHGSLLDYLYNTSGSDWTASPYNCGESVCASIGAVTGDNIVRALTNQNLTWRGYFEDMPSQAYLGGDTANYVQRHNPFVWYSDVANSVTQQDNMYPFTQFAVDLGNNSFQNFSYIVPNLLDDAHGTGTQTPTDLLSTADSWLQTNIGPLLSAPNGPFQQGGDGILIVVFDEAEQNGVSGDIATDSSCSPTQSTGCGGHVALVMIGPNVIQGSTTSNTYQYQDVLHTIIHLLGMSDYMNNASGASDVALLPGT
jgi:acid phosphatase